MRLLWLLILTVVHAHGHRANFSVQELYNLTTTFWDAFIYPNNCAQAKSINSTLLADNIEGRIDITRTFVGSELNTEYLFGLFCNAAGSGFSIVGVPTSYTVNEFVGSGDLVSVTTTVNMTYSALAWVSPIQITSFITFDKQGKINQYDAVFKWLDWQFATLLQKAQALAPNSSVVQLVDSLLVQEICSTANQYCVGDLQQYNSTNDCSTFLQSVRLGGAWELGMNTLACRAVHRNMVPYRPDVHCPHIGKSGGGYCTDDRSYNTYVNQPFFTLGSLVRNGSGHGR